MFYPGSLAYVASTSASFGVDSQPWFKVPAGHRGTAIPPPQWLAAQSQLWASQLGDDLSHLGEVEPQGANGLASTKQNLEVKNVLWHVLGGDPTVEILEMCCTASSCTCCLEAKLQTLKASICWLGSQVRVIEKRSKNLTAYEFPAGNIVKQLTN